MPTIEDALLAENNGIRERLKKFRYLVLKLRDAQKAYFAARRDDKTPPSVLQETLVAAKQAEREVDTALKEFDALERPKAVPEAQQATMDFDEI